MVSGLSKENNFFFAADRPAESEKVNEKKTKQPLSKSQFKQRQEEASNQVNLICCPKKNLICYSKKSNLICDWTSLAVPWSNRSRLARSFFLARTRSSQPVVAWSENFDLSHHSG
jgi:hypothetical protein